MKALLIYPRFPVTYWGFQYGLRMIGGRPALRLGAAWQQGVCAPPTRSIGVD
jgi:hypothetical protein